MGCVTLLHARASATKHLAERPCRGDWMLDGLEGLQSQCCGTTWLGDRTGYPHGYYQGLTRLLIFETGRDCFDMIGGKKMKTGRDGTVK